MQPSATRSVPLLAPTQSILDGWSPVYKSLLARQTLCFESRHEILPILHMRYVPGCTSLRMESDYSDYSGLSGSPGPEPSGMTGDQSIMRTLQAQQTGYEHLLRELQEGQQQLLAAHALCKSLRKDNLALTDNFDKVSSVFYALRHRILITCFAYHDRFGQRQFA